jgi:hypothetical protein
VPATYDKTHGRHVGKAVGKAKGQAVGKMQNKKKKKEHADYPTVKQSTNHAFCDCGVTFAML